MAQKGARWEVTSLWPRIVLVSKDGYAQFRTIGEAIRDAEPGTRIVIRPGTYAENLNLDRKVLLVGDGPVESIIVLPSGGPALAMESDEAAVHHLTLGTLHGKEPTVSVGRGRLQMKECVVRAGPRVGVEVLPRASAALHSCLVTDAAEGVLVHEHGEAVMVRCQVADVRGACVQIQPEGRFEASESHLVRGRVGVEGRPLAMLELTGCDVREMREVGLAVHSGVAPVIRGCEVHHNGGAGVSISGGGLLEECAVFTNRQAGVEVFDGASVVLRKCRIRDGLRLGVHIHSHGGGLLEECDIYGNAVANVLVEQGSNPVVRSCQIHEANQGCGIHFRKCAKGTIEDCEVYKNPDPGIVIADGAAPVIRRCKIRDGGHHGVLFRTSAKGGLEDCELFGNRLAGIAISQGSDPTITRCQMHDHPFAGLFVCEDGKGTIVSCEVKRSRMAGVLLESGGSPVLDQCHVQENGHAGVSVLADGLTRLRECRITRNGSVGLHIGDGGQAFVTACHIEGNGYEPIRIDPGGRCSVEGGSAMLGSDNHKIDVAPGALLRNEPER